MPAADGGGFRTLYHPEVTEDLASLPANMRTRVVDAVESRLGLAPHEYGQRLRQSLRRFWKLRVGDYRVVYEIAGKEVRVYGILHRRDVYGRVGKRTGRGWPHAPE